MKKIFIIMIIFLSLGIVNNSNASEYVEIPKDKIKTQINTKTEIKVNDIIKMEDINNIYNLYLNYNVSRIDSIAKLEIIKYNINIKIESIKINNDINSKEFIKYYNSLSQYIDILKDKIEIIEKDRTLLLTTLHTKLDTKLNNIFNNYNNKILLKLKILLEKNYQKLISNTKEKTSKDIIKILQIKVIIDVLENNINKKKIIEK